MNGRWQGYPKRCIWMALPNSKAKHSSEAAASTALNPFIANGLITVAISTLIELNKWFVQQIVGKYHNTPHRGLRGGPPNGAWALHAVPALPPGPLRKFRKTFLPGITRTLRRDGIVVKHLRYWHPIFGKWLGRREKQLLHYDPRDPSRLFVKDTDDYIEVPFSDLRQPAVSLWEVDAATKHLREMGQRSIVPTLLIDTIKAQRELIKKSAIENAQSTAS